MMTEEGEREGINLTNNQEKRKRTETETEKGKGMKEWKMQKKLYCNTIQIQ